MTPWCLDCTGYWAWTGYWQSKKTSAPPSRSGLFVGLDRLPQDNTMGPLNTRSLTDNRRRARELIPPLQKGKFATEKKPNNKHHKMYWQFVKPPGQLPREYLREDPRATLMEGVDRRYKGLETRMTDFL